MPEEIKSEQSNHPIMSGLNLILDCFDFFLKYVKRLKQTRPFDSLPVSLLPFL